MTRDGLERRDREVTTIKGKAQNMNSKKILQRDKLLREMMEDEGEKNES